MTAIISESRPAPRGLIKPCSAGGGVTRGRARERQAIGDLLQRAEGGAGGVVLADGEPGIGRSRLLRAAVDEAAGRGFSLVSGTADQPGQAIGSCALSAALGEPAGGRHLRARLERRAAAAPVLVALDDLQFASPVTLAALRTLPRDLKGHPVAWLLTRSTTAPRVADRLFGLLEQDGAARLTLGALDADCVTAMLADAFGAPPDRALAGLAADAAGNPALLTELLGGLRDERLVQVSDGRAGLASTRLPQRVHRLARRRLDALGRQARHLLVTAAVLGPAFRLEDAAEMLGHTPAALLPAVEEAMDAAVITAADSAFAFRHQLLRRAVGETIPRPARQALHRQYGELLLARGESAGRAAGHLLQAAHPAEYADRRSLAGLDQAAARTRRCSPQAAAGLAVRALELTSPADPAALSRGAAAAEALAAAGQLDRATRIAGELLTRPLPPAAEDRVRCALASVLCTRGRARDAAGQAQLVLARPDLPGDLRDQALTAQLQALTGLHDAAAGPVADAVLAEPGGHDGPAVAAALVARAVLAWDRGQPAEAVAVLRDAARSDAGISPDARQVQPLLALAAALVDLRQLGQAEDILRAADHPQLHGIPAQAGLSLLRARIALAAGRPADAADDARAALATAEALGADGYAATARCVLSMIELRRGDLAAAAQHLAGRPAAGPQFADLYARPETALAQAQVSEARDGAAAALSQFGTDLTARPGLLLGDPAAAAWLTRTALAAGDAGLARRVACTARALADAHPPLPALAAAAAHSHGLAAGDPAALARAAEQHPDPWARASAAEDLGVRREAQGDRDQAIAHLKDALGGYGRAGAEHDQARIRRRLRQLGIRRRHWTTSVTRPVAGWDSLTGTEQAVAGLVAEGLNNGQVAARMYISTHTVAHHLRQSFRKLSIASRVELTRIVLEQAAGSS